MIFHVFELLSESIYFSSTRIFRKNTQIRKLSAYGECVVDSNLS